VINMGDLLDRRITLPPDDAGRPDLRRFVARPVPLPREERHRRNRPQVCVGILELLQEHPDFGRGGTFYVLPGASPPKPLFNQPPTRARSCSSWRATATRLATTRSGTPTSPNTPRRRCARRWPTRRYGSRGTCPTTRSHPGAAARRVSPDVSWVLQHGQGTTYNHEPC